MTNSSGFIGKAEGVGMVTNPGPWVDFAAGETVRCPALTAPDSGACGRKLRDVGAGLRLSVRVRAHQGMDKPTRGMTMEKCGKCGTVLECKEAHG